MENYDKPIINYRTIVFFIFQFIFIILMIVMFSNLNAPEVINTGIEIDGLSNINGLSSEDQTTIRHKLYEAVAFNSETNNIPESGAIIRDGSLINNFYEDFDMNYLSFIVDLSNVEQSYRIYYEWSNDENNQYVSPDDAGAVMCVDDDEIIYDEFNCKNNDKYYKNVIVNRMAYRYGYMLPGFSDLNVMPEGDVRSEDFKVKLNYLICSSQCDCLSVSENAKAEAISGFETFLNGLGIGASDVKYYFDNCQNS